MSRLRDRLSRLLAEQGFAVTPESLTPAQGFHRTSPWSEAYRWTGFGQHRGISVVVDSWDTMTACMGGITIDPDGPASYLVSALRRKEE